MADVAHRVVLGAEDDPRVLAVTHGEWVGPDPVALWRDDVEPGLRNTGDYRRIGDIRATSHQRCEAADIQWLAGGGGDRAHAFGPGPPAR
ncbi:hypothetical protein [Streptomyces sp. DH24]|uniref:hypothetical protein n=1 Tax=Streptomyces sp. DH24 TaxID=3040123 RepID=UPI0024420CA9|nr:hypothetical protein [Streptomyces sp. DH24]MDG9717952.1 hypothetical protein [Streptomyces sp. DH24]